jgi:hypothetical protein
MTPTAGARPALLAHGCAKAPAGTAAGASLHLLTAFAMPQNCFGNWATIPVLSMSAMRKICS